MLRVPVLYVLLFVKLHPVMGKKALKCKNHVIYTSYCVIGSLKFVG